MCASAFEGSSGSRGWFQTYIKQQLHTVSFGCVFQPVFAGSSGSRGWS